MKYALIENGERIEAGAGAPAQALCPYCGGPVTLRRRRRSTRSVDVTYFWRHLDHTNLTCPARFPAGYRGNINRS